MKAVFWNCSHGASAKIDIIQNYVHASNPELLFISEAEIKPDRDCQCLNLVGYHLGVSKMLKHGLARTLVYVFFY